MFYKCYNEDAMVFSRYIKAYQVSAKYVKSAGSDVLSLGFPEIITSQSNENVVLLLY